MIDLTLLGPVVLMAVLLLIGVPVAFSLAISGALGMIMMLGLDRSMGILITSPHSNVSTYLWTTIPLFILMAEFLSKSDITSDAFKAGHYWLGHIPGGLAMATTIANGGMAALSGSSIAAAATMSKIAVPEMQKYGYDDRMSMGTVSAAGTFATMLPPSLGLIVYGILTGHSIATLFIGAIIPGLLTVVGYIAVIYLWGVINPDVFGRPSEKKSIKERLSIMKTLYPAGLLLVIVIGGLYSGAITPTEAGGVGAAGALLVAVLFTDISIANINEAIGDALYTTTMIFMILIGAMFFSYYLTVTRTTQELITYVGELPLNVWIILFIILFVYVALGTLLNTAAVFILTLPLTYPIVVDGLGFHPIWFGVVLVKIAEVGLVTPPLGLNVYVASSAVDMEVETAFAGAARFLIADFAVLALLLMFPDLVLYLTRTM